MGLQGCLRSCRDLNNYLFLGFAYYSLLYNIPQNPILIVKAATLPPVFTKSRVWCILGLL